MSLTLHPGKKVLFLYFRFSSEPQKHIVMRVLWFTNVVYRVNHNILVYTYCMPLIIIRAMAECVEPNLDPLKATVGILNCTNIQPMERFKLPTGYL